MSRFPALAFAVLLLAGCSTSEPKPPSFAASENLPVQQGTVSQGFALPPPATTQSQAVSSTTSDMDSTQQTFDSPSASAFPAAPSAPAVSNCRTVGAVTTCDAPPNPAADGTNYTN